MYDTSQPPHESEAAPPSWVKMSELARRSGVPAATIKHYLREGLLPEPRRTSRNMAYYDLSLVGRIQRIKELQKTRFLPLKVIKEVLDRKERDDLSLSEALSKVVKKKVGEAPARSKRELIDSGVPEAQLDFFQGLGLIEAVPGEDGRLRYEGEDLELLRILGRARKAGLDPELLPHTILVPYMKAIRELVRTELSLFRAGIENARAKESEERESEAKESTEAQPERDIAALAELSAELSERLILTLRKKMLLPTLEELVKEEGASEEG